MENNMEKSQNTKTAHHDSKSAVERVLDAQGYKKHKCHDCREEITRYNEYSSVRKRPWWKFWTNLYIDIKPLCRKCFDLREGI